MHLLKETKAVSTFLLILLMLCSAVFGAFLSYVWVMANFYFEPENTVELVITEVSFPVDHADYFNITVMNPSHSASGTNITEIYFTVSGNETAWYATDTDPELPITVERATSKTIKCLRNWGEFAGSIITVHVSAMDASGALRSVQTAFVQMEVETYFNVTENCKYFNVTVTNYQQSALNLTLSNVYFDSELVENMSIELPRSLAKGETFTFQCFVDWSGHESPLVQIETLEGYYAEVRKEAPSTVVLSITDVAFNEANSSEINITLSNSAESATLVDITDIVLTYDNRTEEPIQLFDPPHRIEKNETATFNCVWNWTDYRDRNVAITAHTKQGFTSLPKTVKTPQSVIFRITELDFNLTKTEYFLVTVRNMPCSVRNVSITHIKFDQNETDFESQTIPVGEEKQFNCTWNWAALRGENETVTVYTEDGLNVSQSLTLPAVELRIEACDFGESATGPRYYFNLTISNSEFSSRNVNVTQILLEEGNETYQIDGTMTNPTIYPGGYVLARSSNITIYCPWNWSLHSSQMITLNVYTAEGFQTSRTFQVP